ncbi:50S ribosomal protein L30e-like protein [Podospora didyma]|uniref:50S ribosomal protein L30e-like protein n=1 Tax=Podospora didyma TaxID=330526 RepID=A0AAE0KK66_9PEZI|nr:50S ribosomal protein L30e-like protein [Podospora didyma]
MGSSEKIDKKLKKEKKSEDKIAKKEKKDKKRSESDGVKKEVKDKKKDKKKQENLARALDAHLQADAAASSGAAEEDDDEKKPTAGAEIDPEDTIQGGAKELVPFAFPIADEKAHKKIYKLIRKGAKVKAIHRGVKECEKAIKKCALKKAGASPSDAPGIVIIAGDISPMEVIMHFPVLCEEHGVPYMFVNSRTELGQSACTKRATSVVMLKPAGKKSAGGDAAMDEGEAEEYLKLWKDMSKNATKEWTAQVESWVKGIHPKQVAANVRRS